MKPILHLLGDRYKAQQYVRFAERKLAELKTLMKLLNLNMQNRLYRFTTGDIEVYIESYLGIDKIRIFAKKIKEGTTGDADLNLPILRGWKSKLAAGPTDIWADYIKWGGVGAGINIEFQDSFGAWPDDGGYDSSAKNYLVFRPKQPTLSINFGADIRLHGPQLTNTILDGSGNGRQYELKAINDTDDLDSDFLADWFVPGFPDFPYNIGVGSILTDDVIGITIKIQSGQFLVQAWLNGVAKGSNTFSSGRDGSEACLSFIRFNVSPFDPKNAFITTFGGDNREFDFPIAGFVPLVPFDVLLG